MKIFFSNHRNKHRTHFKPTTLVQPKTISGLLVVGISFLRGTTLYVITDKSELAAVSDLNEKEVDEIFRQLDLDNDGRISVEEFSKSFQNFTDVVAEIKSQKEEKLADSQKGLLALKNELGKEGCIVTSKQYVSELYHNLSDANKPDLLDLFEKHLGSVVEDIKSRTAENQRLEEALKRATHQHAKQVHNLDREVEQQMERLEAKVRQEEKSFFEKKLADYKLLLESKEKEISAMSNALETLETKLDNETKKPNFDKDKYENVTEENRFLKSQVIDSQTTLALLRSEMAELKSQFVEQSDQLQKEQNTVQTFVDEQEHLTRQLKLLHEANQRLQDINDELRAALEERRNSSAYQTQNSLEVMKLSGLFSDVNDNEEDLPLLNRRNTFPRKRRNRFSLDANPVEFHNNTLNEDSLFTEINHASTPVKSALIDEEDEKSYETLTSTSHTADVKKQIQILEDTNKRLGNSNDELRTALKMLARSASFRKPKRSSSLTRRAMSSHSDYSSLSSNRSSRSFSPKKKSSSNFDVGEATDESTTYDVDEEERIGNDSSATMNSETIAELNTQIRDEMIEHKKQMIKSNSQSRSDLDDDDDGEEMNSTELAELVAMASDLTDITDSDDEEEVNDGMNKTSQTSSMTASLTASYCTPERMYKLVLAGDAAVGKSSFILRLCKNKFHSSLNATLGVDFQVKNVKVDSKTIALQLWDTAGQERFRSIAKSYFRKVDGVLLLYDVTCESSFVHIRDWIATIEECSHKKVPIMICANKCDLREEYIKEGRKVVTKESGLRLAKYYDALFIEISAKDGHHIEKACKDLSRILTSLENEEIEQSGLKLERKEKDKKKLPCCTS
ncbi:ras and EF-hand domain-containing protein homolog isoform X5 [Xenia sp. Carnegie-2017]|uniref:ras and EF-hand domain-containing protein homolog isoform X5 n=1 Tax=Xenia sp. Carnegie-2017 TaxID=2897299 RepID=UPI001F05024C|nr:ras and EF-hand domain-containing protein homolog isoform X5 [Xenia sp. Carnegie-2017]